MNHYALPRIRAALVCLLLVPAGVASAIVKTVHTPVTSVTVYAPDWVWLGQNANLLAVAEVYPNTNQVRATVSLWAPDVLGHEESESSRLNLLSAGPGTYRFALSNVLIKDVPPGVAIVFELRLIVMEEGAIDPSELLFEIPIEVRRGATVSEGIWSAILPAVVAAAWCLVFTFYLVRRASKGAWKTPSDPVWDGEGHDA